MKRERLVGIGLLIAIACTWGLFAALVIWGLNSDQRRTGALGEVALERVLGSQRSQLSMALAALEQDLREEVAFAGRSDSTTDSTLCDRWLPLLKSQWAITAVGMATEHGREVELARLEDRWRCTSTRDDSTNGRPRITEWPLLESAGNARSREGDKALDPRRALWFGQALESHAPGPVWSTSTTADSTDELHVSLLLREERLGEGYRILRFKISPTVLVRSLGPPSPERRMIYLNTAGRPWLVENGQGGEDPGSAALETWRQTRSNEPFRVTEAGVSYMARLIPFTRNGLNLYIGAFVDMHRMEDWMRGERLALWTAAVLLVLLALLMVLAFRRSRSRELRAERQERRSETQERKLAKALGEREILDREVHHRVKNNLQVVSSLLNLQAERVPGTEARREFTRGKRRIDSMALVHHKLYMQQDLRAIDLQLFLSQVADAMKAMHEPHSRSVSHVVDAQSIRADADTSIQVGLILCELLSNCFQHAFPYVTGGHVDIQVRAVDGDLYKLSVQDNGKGMDRDPATRETELGLELVEALADQIDGAVTVSTERGTRAEVTFRMQGYAGMKTI